MIIKYATPDEGLQLTEIVDVTFYNGSAVFSVSSCSGLKDIAIKDVTEDEYKGIIHSLYANGKADLTCYANRTFYYDEDEDEESEEEGYDCIGEDCSGVEENIISQGRDVEANHETSADNQSKKKNFLNVFRSKPSGGWE